MGVPSVVFTKTDFQTGSVPSSVLGILAIIAPAAAGPVNTPAMFQGDALAFSTFGPSPLAEDSSYTLARSNNPIIAVRPTTSVAAAYGPVTKTIAGTAVPVAGAAVPADSYQVLVSILNGGTIGVAGITYTYSLDGGNTVSAVQALGVGTVLTIPNFAGGGSPGVSFSIPTGTSGRATRTRPR